jgi:hypothetical protein
MKSDCHNADVYVGMEGALSNVIHRCVCSKCKKDCFPHVHTPLYQARAICDGSEAVITLYCRCGAHKLYRVQLEGGMTSEWCPPVRELSEGE